MNLPSVSERRIGRLMKEIGLYVKKYGPRLNSANDRQYQYYPNRLQRNFLSEAPNKVWVSDITYARVSDLYSVSIDYLLHDHADDSPKTQEIQEAQPNEFCALLHNKMHLVIIALGLILDRNRYLHNGGPITKRRG